MRAFARRALGLLASGAMLLLSGCAHLWAPPRPQLIFGPPVIQGEYGEIVVSVAHVPRGMGALAVAYGGISYPAAKMVEVEVEGMNGYTAFAQRFVSGQGGFVISSISGLEAGPVARIRFRALAPVSPGEISVDGSAIYMVDGDNKPVDFELSRPAYYAR